MKFKHLITTFALAGVLGLGVAAGFASTQEKPVEEAKADSASVVYLMPNNNWKSSTQWFAIDVYNGGTHKWVKMTETSVGGVFQATIPSGTWTNIIFTRMSNATTGDSGDGWIGDTHTKWNQTNDLSIPNLGSNDCYAFYDKYDNWGGNADDGGWGFKFSTEETTVMLYDADDYFDMEGNTATIYAWDATYEKNIKCNSYPGKAMTLGALLNGHKTYSYTFNSMYFEYCSFNGGGSTEHADSTKTGNLPIEKGKIYNLRIGSDWSKTGAWYTSEVTDEATSFVYSKMYMSTYDRGGVKGTQTGDMSCLTYYNDAKLAYLSLTNDALNAVKNTYSFALDRLSEWAIYNKEQFDVNTGFASRVTVRGVEELTRSTSSVTIIIIVSTLALTAAGGYFLLRRKED